MTYSVQLPASLQNARAKIDALSLRERMLLFGTVVMLLSAIWYFAMMQPLLDRATANRQQISAVHARIDTINNSLESQVLQFSTTGSEQQRQFDRIQSRIDELNERLGDYAAELIGPAEMTRVLEGVLRDQADPHRPGASHCTRRMCHAPAHCRRYPRRHRCRT